MASAASDTRKQLRRFFEVDRHYVAVAALKALADEEAIAAQKVTEAIKKYGLDPEKPNPPYGMSVQRRASSGVAKRRNAMNRRILQGSEMTLPVSNVNRSTKSPISAISRTCRSSRCWSSRATRSKRRIRWSRWNSDKATMEVPAPRRAWSRN